MLFGMATLSMCFTLVQDQMAAKFRMLGQKCGLLSRFKSSSKDDDDGDEGDGGETSGRAVRPALVMRVVRPVPVRRALRLVPVQRLYDLFHFRMAVRPCTTSSD